MPISLFQNPSFKRFLKALGIQQREIVGTILEALVLYYETNFSLEKASFSESSQLCLKTSACLYCHFK